MDTDRVVDLAAKLHEVFANEKELTAQRAKLEAQIFSIYADSGDAPTEGNKTHRVSGFKITLGARVNRTVNAKAWRDVEQELAKLDPTFPGIVDFKPSVSAAGCKWLAEHNPQAWAIAARAITEKPGKPGCKVEPITEE